MKITGPGPIRPTTTRPSRVSRGAKSAEFSSRVLRESEAANHVIPVTTVDALGGLLAAQEVPDATDDRSRGIARGADLLDRLDDARLDAVLDEIDLRASVELAKLGITP